MFFVGVMGLDAKVKPAGYLHLSGHCPACGSTKAFHLADRYQYFHAFFLPLWRFGEEFFATCPDCASVFSLPVTLGKQALQEGSITAAPSVLTPVRLRQKGCCPNCGAVCEDADAFCRHCGTALR